MFSIIKPLNFYKSTKIDTYIIRTRWLIACNRLSSDPRHFHQSLWPCLVLLSLHYTLHKLYFMKVRCRWLTNTLQFHRSSESAPFNFRQFKSPLPKKRRYLVSEHPGDNNTDRYGKKWNIFWDVNKGWLEDGCGQQTLIFSESSRKNIFRGGFSWKFSSWLSLLPFAYILQQ